MTYHWTINGVPSCESKPSQKIMQLYKNRNIMTGCSSESESEVLSWVNGWNLEFPEDKTEIVPTECPLYLASDSYGGEDV